MKSVRKGNDISIAWTINSGETPFSLEGKDITLYLHNPYGKEKVEGYSVKGNVLSWTFLGKGQKVTGKYSLILVVNEGARGMITTDSCDFVNLVPCSCQIGGEDNDGVQTEVIELTSEVSIGGYDDTEIRQELTNVNATALEAHELATLANERIDAIEIEVPEVDLSEINQSLDKIESELTELSLQVGKVSERVDDLEQGGQGGSDIFKAEYGKTTIEEIAEAYNAGKILHCDYNGYCYTLAKFNNGSAFFAATAANYNFRIVCNSNSAWGAPEIFTLEITSNKVKTINEASTDTQYPSAKAVYDALQNVGGGGTSSDKQGVVSQTLNYNTADNTYSVSNVVRGAIPSFFIDLVTEAGATFNAESGYFSLNGIDNIAYDEMRQIYDCRTGYGTNSLLAVYSQTYTARTNFAAFRGYGNSFSNHEPTTIYVKYLCGKNASITKFALCDEVVALCVKQGSGNNFESLGLGGAPKDRSRLEEIIGVLDITNLTGSNNFFYNGAYHAWLTTFKLKALKASIDLSGMPRLNEATILYMINNEKAASAITIKLHADAKAMADASEAIQSALAAHTNITLGV